MARVQGWDSGDLGCFSRSAPGLLDVLGQITSRLCASVSPWIRWDLMILTCFEKRFETYGLKSIRSELGEGDRDSNSRIQYLFCALHAHLTVECSWQTERTA